VSARSVPTPPRETSETDLDAMMSVAVLAARSWGGAPPSFRAAALRTVAESLDASAQGLVSLADCETHLGSARLAGELARTTFQLRLFAEVLEEGAYLQATIDHTDTSWPPGPRPDLRRILHPLGPVVVFGASNFPFAFSTAGGDTASALAAGCPVLFKAHPGHPRLAAATAAVITDALASKCSPDGTFSVFYGDAAARSVLTDARVTAGAFTGSLAGGRTLFNLATSRPNPIPFYAELGSVNPVFVTAQALDARRSDILSGYVESFTLGAGQFCTKPGLLFTPAGSGVIDEVAEILETKQSAELLNEAIALGYDRRLRELSTDSALHVVVAGSTVHRFVSPSLLATSARELVASHDRVVSECFGPASIVVSYETMEELIDVAGILEGQLTATIWARGDETDLVELLRPLVERVGRVVFNGWPTGLTVSWATQHGGPYPATTAPLSTSVGTRAIERFLRPVAYQDLPDELLPAGLKDSNPLGLPRLIDGSTYVPPLSR